MAVKVLGSKYKNLTAPKGRVYVEKNGTILLRPAAQPLTTEEAKKQGPQIETIGKTYKGKSAGEGNVFIRKHGQVLRRPADDPLTTQEKKQMGQAIQFRESEQYKRLTSDMQELVDLSFQVFEVGSEQQAAQFVAAINEAKKNASADVKAELTMARMEFESKAAEITGNTEFKKEAIERGLKELKEDVATSRQEMTLETQAEIARQTRAYEEDLLQIADVSADRGVTFGQGRNTRGGMEDVRGEQQTDVLESIERRKSQQERRLEQAASRGDIEAQTQLSQLQEERRRALEGTARKAEISLGSDMASKIPGLGGLPQAGLQMGSIQREQRGILEGNIKEIFSQMKGI